MTRKAIAIGINRYPGLDKLAKKGAKCTGSSDIPAQDAETIAQLLERYGSFHPVYRFPQGFANDGKPWVDPKPQEWDNSGTDELKKAIVKLFLPSEDIPDTALLFFSGHGLTDSNGATILATTYAHSRDKEWGISLDWLCDILKQSPVKEQIVWLDCCYSGQLIKIAENFQPDSEKRRFFIVASLGSEEAYASATTQQGILTEILIQGLDPTRPSEGLINNFSLARYISDNPPKTPQKIQVDCGDREILLTCSDKYRLEALLLKQKKSSAAGSPSSTLTWKCVHTLRGHKDSIRSIAINPHSQTIASGSFDKTIKLWRLDTGELIDTLTGHSGTVTSVAFSPDGQSLASAAAYPDDTVKLWHPDTGRLLRNLQDPSLIVMSVWSVAFSPDGQTLVSSHNDNTIKLWHLPTGEKLRTFKGNLWPNCFRSVAFSPDGRTLIGGSFDNTIKLWQLRTNEEIRTLDGSSGWLGSVQSWMKSANDGTGITSIAISPDGQILASGSLDKTVKLWRLNDGTLRSNFTGHSDGVESVAINFDGQTIASGSRDKSIRIWNLQTEKLLCVLTEHSDTVYSVAFSPDGLTLVSCSADMTIKIWQRG